MPKPTQRFETVELEGTQHVAIVADAKIPKQRSVYVVADKPHGAIGECAVHPSRVRGSELGVADTARQTGVYQIGFGGFVGAATGIIGPSGGKHILIVAVVSRLGDIHIRPMDAGLPDHQHIGRPISNVAEFRVEIIPRAGHGPICTIGPTVGGIITLGSIPIQPSIPAGRAGKRGNGRRPESVPIRSNFSNIVEGSLIDKGEDVEGPSVVFRVNRVATRVVASFTAVAPIRELPVLLVMIVEGNPKLFELVFAIGPPGGFPCLLNGGQK